MSDYARLLADGEFRQFLAEVIDTTVRQTILTVGKKPEDEYPELMSLSQTKKFLHLDINLFKAIRNGDLWTVTVRGKSMFRKSDLILFNIHGTARVLGNKPPVTRKSAIPPLKSKPCKSTRSIQSVNTEMRSSMHFLSP